MDLTHIYCGADGWGHLAAIIDCHDREIVGYEFSPARPRPGGRARPRGGLPALASAPSGPTARRRSIRSDNGLIFTARRFRAACRDYRLRQEFITPYTPEQNGMIERFFRSPQGGVRLAAQLRRASPRPRGDQRAGSAGTTRVVPIRRSAT